MKRFLLPAFAAVLFLALAPCTFAGDAKAELQELVEKVKAKLKGGQKTEAALAEELKGFDTLLAAHRGEKTEEVAQILFMKALLYGQVFNNDAKAMELFKQVQTEFAGTEPAKRAETAIAAFAQQAEAEKVKGSLVAGTPFPDFDEKDLEGKPLSVANLKGKIVMIDFWATWCGPCVAELPNVLKAYERYHDKGFEVIGISLDESKDKLTAFLKEKKMSWPQYFDGKGWQNKLAQKYGVNSIPSTYLLDKEGKIIAEDLRGEALDAAVAKALE